MVCNLNVILFRKNSSEYDIIPHVDEGDHKPLSICNDAFGICKCTTTIVFGEYESNTSEPVSDGT